MHQGTRGISNIPVKPKGHLRLLWVEVVSSYARNSLHINGIILDHFFVVSDCSVQFTQTLGRKKWMNGGERNIVTFLWFSPSPTSVADLGDSRFLRTPWITTKHSFFKNMQVLFLEGPWNHYSLLGMSVSKERLQVCMHTEETSQQGSRGRRYAWHRGDY